MALRLKPLVRPHIYKYPVESNSKVIGIINSFWKTIFVPGLVFLIIKRDSGLEALAGEEWHAV
jgi:hypothetical protein